MSFSFGSWCWSWHGRSTCRICHSGPGCRKVSVVSDFAYYFQVCFVLRFFSRCASHMLTFSSGFPQLSVHVLKYFYRFYRDHVYWYQIFTPVTNFNIPFLFFADCRDLILSMLDKDRSRRLTPGPVLDHSWFGDVADVIDLREFVVSRCSSIDEVD